MSQWRAMLPGDLTAVQVISDAVHGRYSEDGAVYAERLALYPAGCLVLEGAEGVTGYLITHPWRRGAPPALNARLGALPAQPDCYYLHDIALMPAARGGGAGAAAVAAVLERTRSAGFAEVALVAINGAERFWAAQGFAHDADAPGMASYGDRAYPMRRMVG